MWASDTRSSFAINVYRTLTFVRTRFPTPFYLVLPHKSPYETDPKQGPNYTIITIIAGSSASHIYAHDSLHTHCVLPWPYFLLKPDQLYLLIADYPVKKETFRDYINDMRERFLLEVFGFKDVTFY